MKGLILSAGQGNRLERLTQDLPKALVKVCGKELIRYQLEFLRYPFIKEIGVVTGYLAPSLTRFIRQSAPDVHLFENPQFEKGNIFSLKSALSFLDDDFLLMNVDHIYPKKLWDKISKPMQDITAACDFDRGLARDDMKVKRNAKGFLGEIHKELQSYDGGYIGLTYCPKQKLPAYLQGLKKVLAHFGEKASVETVLGELAKRGETISIADTSGIRWLEVDTLEDLQKAQNTLQNNPDFLR